MAKGVILVSVHIPNMSIEAPFANVVPPGRRNSSRPLRTLKTPMRRNRQSERCHLQTQKMSELHKDMGSILSTSSRLLASSALSLGADEVIPSTKPYAGDGDKENSDHDYGAHIGTWIYIPGPFLSCP